MEFNIESTADKLKLIKYIHEMRLGAKVVITQGAEGSSKLITKKQRGAIEVYFKIVAESLNDAGLTMQIVLEQAVGRYWTAYMVRESLFKPIMGCMYGYTSTKKLSPVEVSKVEQVLSNHLAEKFGLELHFPTKENR